MMKRVLITIPLLAALTLVGCLGEPEIAERWTLLEFASVNPAPDQPVADGQPIDVSLMGRVTYRDVVTGFMVAEVRYSPTSVPINPGHHDEATAQTVDQIIANSVTMGRRTQIVTGWDHLQQELDLSFTANVPAQMFPGGVGPAVGALYLVLYMGDGNEVELQDGRDSLVVTPFNSIDRQVLHTGYPLIVTPAGGGSQP
jgi:hypothetical protein